MKVGVRQIADAGMSARALSDISPSRQPEVVQWLRLHVDEHYLVSEDGEVIYTDQPRARNTKALEQLLSRYLQRPPRVQLVNRAIFDSFRDLQLEQGQERQVMTDQVAATGTTKAVKKILGDAIDADASDVHLRVREREANVLLRIYGSLLSYETYSRDVGLRLARTLFNHFSRSRGDFSEHIPLDGAFNFHHAEQRYGVRLNLMPELRGCTIVLRIRNPQRRITLAQAGYTSQQIAAIGESMRGHCGLLLFSGPTNSGKSTTVGSLLGEVPAERHVLSIEDPVELQWPLVSQIDLSSLRDDVSLDELLACTVRQDPDLLALAEIRDAKTARYAENMALQGRAIIATLHADGVVGIPARLEKLGMDRGHFHLPGFLSLLVSQFLVPMLCVHCRVQECINSHFKTRSQALFGTPQATAWRRNRAGCERCVGGFAGRTVIAEALPVGRELRQLLLRRDFDGIRDHMRALGIAGRRDHAREKLLAGQVDLETVENHISPLVKGR